MPMCLKVNACGSGYVFFWSDARDRRKDAEDALDRYLRKRKLSRVAIQHLPDGTLAVFAGVPFPNLRDERGRYGVTVGLCVLDDSSQDRSDRIGAIFEAMALREGLAQLQGPLDKIATSPQADLTATLTLLVEDLQGYLRELTAVASADRPVEASMDSAEDIDAAREPIELSEAIDLSGRESPTATATPRLESRLSAMKAVGPWLIVAILAGILIAWSGGGRESEDRVRHDVLQLKLTMEEGLRDQLKTMNAHRKHVLRLEAVVRQELESQRNMAHEQGSHLVRIEERIAHLRKELGMNRPRFPTAPTSRAERRDQLQAPAIRPSPSEPDEDQRLRTGAETSTRPTPDRRRDGR